MHTRSRLQLDITGRVLTNTFRSAGRVNNVDVPQVALLPSDSGATDAFGLTARQTQLGAAMSLTGVLGGTLSGDVDLDFFGGVQNAAGDRRLFPEPRLRTVRARITWPGTEIMVGADVPLISPLNPVSVAATGTPNFSGAGNLWNWLAQARVAHEIAVTHLGHTAVHWGVQAAALSPFAGVQAPGEQDGVDAGERSGRPALEARAHASWGDDDILTGASDASIATNGGEIGVGVHQGWLAVGQLPLQTSQALALDFRVSLAPKVEIRGEGYTGHVLRGLGGGGIGQAFGRAAAGALLGPPLRDRAGWAQLNVQVHPTLLVGSGCGVDVVDQADRPLRQRNTVCAAHVLWRLADPFLVGLEYRHFTTRYLPSGIGRAGHLNVAIGFDL